MVIDTTNLNYKRQYLFFQGVTWVLCHPGRAVSMSFNDTHQLSTLKPFHSVDETTMLTLDLARILTPTFDLIDWVTL